MACSLSWRPLPASIAGGAGARPDHPINGHRGTAVPDPFIPWSLSPSPSKVPTARHPAGLRAAHKAVTTEVAAHYNWQPGAVGRHKIGTQKSILVRVVETIGVAFGEFPPGGFHEETRVYLYAWRGCGNRSLAARGARSANQARRGPHPGQCGQALGHTVRLMPPAYVKPYVKRQKNDTADAEAICEAVTRANMRFVPTKTPEQQSCLMLHRTRHLFIRQQTAVINSIRAHLAEFGIVAPVGRKGVTELLHVVADPSDKRVPAVGRACLAALGDQLLGLKRQILEFDRMIMAWHRSNQTSKRLHYIPGVGPMLATALVASVADPRTFRSGRNFSAWIGLVPKQHSSGGKERLGSISKQGDRYLRSLFVAGALAVIRYAKIHGTGHRPWLTALLGRRPAKVAAIALANKIARMAWAMMAKGERYKQPVALAA